MIKSAYFEADKSQTFRFSKLGRYSIWSIIVFDTSFKLCCYLSYIYLLSVNSLCCNAERGMLFSSVSEYLLVAYFRYIIWFVLCCSTLANTRSRIIVFCALHTHIHRLQFVRLLLLFHSFLFHSSFFFWQFFFPIRVNAFFAVVTTSRRWRARREGLRFGSVARLLLEIRHVPQDVWACEQMCARVCVYLAVHSCFSPLSKLLNVLNEILNVAMLQIFFTRSALSSAGHNIYNDSFRMSHQYPNRIIRLVCCHVCLSILWIYSWRAKVQYLLLCIFNEPLFVNIW